MKLTARTYRKLYRVLDGVSPVPMDCGTICGKACCTGPEDLGIFLLPGEEELQKQDPDWLTWSVEQSPEWDFLGLYPEEEVWFVRCKDPLQCHRENRPIQCRTFPAEPHLREDGSLVLIYNDLDLPYTCPLIAADTVLDEDFLETTYRVWQRLLADPRVYRRVERSSRARTANAEEPDVLFP